MHPLALLSVGVYGEVLPPQNGAPLRITLPWKYGYKSIKSIVKIRLVEKQPPTTWNLEWPEAYGFYSNVNPEVDHPTHSQATEDPAGAEQVRAANQDAEVQRLRRPGGESLRGDGSAQELLTPHEEILAERVDEGACLCSCA